MTEKKSETVAAVANVNNTALMSAQTSNSSEMPFDWECQLKELEMKITNAFVTEVVESQSEILEVKVKNKVDEIL